ncbi:MAG: OmpA family protein, partial [Elusimicrobiota bacterium]|nr:OmpA family protein [Elusimicrobiota bacterium]
MRIHFILALFILVSAGCYSGNKKAQEERPREKEFTKSGTCYLRNDEEKLRNQTLDQMRASRRVPSVDFEFDSIVLRPSDYKPLDTLAALLVANRSMKVIVEAHTDSVGSHEYNDWLSNSRAVAIKSYLNSRGVHPDAVKTSGY